MKKLIALFFYILLLSCCKTTSSILTVKDTILKPRIVFHGSANKNLKIIEPRARGVRDPKEDNIVFAAIDPGHASIFMTQTYQFSKSGRFCGACPFYFVYSDKEKFLKLDKGGSLYFLPIDSFFTDSKKGSGVNEWVSTSSTKPLYKIDFKSSLEAMLSLGVQVYFVSDEIFKRIDRSSDHGKSILLKLESENQKLGKNYFQLTGLGNNR